MVRPRPDAEFAVLRPQEQFTPLNVYPEPTLDNLDVLFLIRVKVHWWLLRGDGHQTRMLEFERHLEGEGAVGMCNDTGCYGAFEAVGVIKVSRFVAPGGVWWLGEVKMRTYAVITLPIYGDELPSLAVEAIFQ